MTPRERAIESLALLRQNASKRNATYSQCFLDDMADVTEHAIIADRQALQSEICKKMELIKRMEGLALLSGLLVYNMIVGIIQSIFAQQSQPEESKPERLMISQEEFNRCIKQANENYREAERRYQACYTELTKTQAESDRRVLAEREACVTIADNEASKAEHWLNSGQSTSPQYTKGTKEGAKEISRLIRARSNQPEESRPFSIFKPADSYFISVKESDRRVLAEREACAKICDAYEVYCKSAFPVIHKPMEFGIAVSTGLAHNIRARSNQPEEKPNLTPFDPECSTCVRDADEAADRAAKRVERMISSADRIATLHEWQAKDAQTIEQLNASNRKLSEENFALREKVRRLERDHFGSILAAAERDRQKIAQLEKEKNELEVKERERRETRSDWHTHFCDKPGCETTACECPTKYFSASRKA